MILSSDEDQIYLCAALIDTCLNAPAVASELEKTIAWITLADSFGIDPADLAAMSDEIECFKKHYPHLCDRVPPWAMWAVDISTRDNHGKSENAPN